MDDFRNRLKFMPLEMTQHLKRDENGVTYYDRDSMVDDAGSTKALYFVLNGYFQIKWSLAEHLTAYFESRGGEIWGGCYDLISHKKVSARKLISCSANTPYTYTKEDIEKMIECINCS